LGPSSFLSQRFSAGGTRTTKRTDYKENAEALIVATKEIGLEVNADKTNYIMSRNQDAGQIVPLKGWKSSNIWEQP